MLYFLLPAFCRSLVQFKVSDIPRLLSLSFHYLAAIWRRNLRLDIALLPIERIHIQLHLLVRHLELQIGSVALAVGEDLPVFVY